MRMDHSPIKYCEAPVALCSASQPNKIPDLGDESYSLTQLSTREPSAAEILNVVFDMFAGRATHAYTEDLEWWAEAIQKDIGPEAAAGLALVALSKHQADLRAGARGVNELRTLLLERAHMLTNGPGAKVQP